MEVEKQVSNKELSKQLKELGVKQESMFYWNDINDNKIFKNKWKNIPFISNGKNSITSSNKQDQEYIDKNYKYSAFTVAELGVLLPPFYKSHRFFDLWYCEYTDQYNHVERCIDDTEADSRAKMLIYLIENKLIVLK